ncbi:MAG: MopE-related protein [Kofleriaceae bacterium]
MIRPLVRSLGLIAALVGATASMSCNINEYCLNCATNGDGGTADASDAGDGGLIPDGPDAGPCTPTGIEVCDGIDNDCDGTLDESPPTVGDPCANQMGQCAGGVITCTSGALGCSKPSMPEQCDNLDNDCDGMFDEGNPGGGALCGTNEGECVAGMNQCVGGAVMCVGATGTVGGQPELCNNRDDDCDGAFDEGLTNLGACVPGVDGPAQGDEGLCNLGTRACLGGTVICQNAVFPTFEECDALDQDCDGDPTNGFNLNTDPQNCGMCGKVCSFDHAFAGCGGTPVGCFIAACQAGYHDNNTDDSDGCEFGPCTITSPFEVCNGLDDDCSGTADDGLTAPVGLCRTQGECAAGNNLSCDGASGWSCHYTDPDVEVDSNGNIVVQETLCDGKDNDCDGAIDEGHPNKGLACDNGGVGDCESTGNYICNTADPDGPTVCNYTVVGPGMSASETCDGRDNDCDTHVDEGGATGNLAGQEWVTVPNTSPAVQIMKYEASRPDATAATSGSSNASTCSRQNVQPWVNVTYPQAVAACTAVGARLCTEAEWQAMCAPETTYPVTGPSTTGATDFVYIEAEDAFANTTIGGATRAWTKISPLDFHGVIAMQVPDNGFAVTNSANALTQSSRLDYRLTLLGSTNYRVWVRMRAPEAPPVTPVDPFGIHTAATATLAPVSNAATAVGDLVIVTTFTAGGSGVPTHTLQSGFTLMASDSNNDGSTDTAISVAYKVATVAGAQTYQAFTSSNGSGNVSGIVVLKAGTYDISTFLADTTDSDSSGAPNPPDAGSLSRVSAVLAIGAWHTSSTVAVTPPSGYTELWEMAGSNAAELSVAGAVLSAGEDPDPGSFGDDVSPNGTAAATIAIPLANVGVSSNAVWVGLAQGSTAGAASSGNVTISDTDQWQWIVSPSLTSGAAGTHTFSLYTREDGLMIDKIAISRQSSQSPTFENSWAYETNPRTAQPQTCNSDEVDTDATTAGDQDGILATGAKAACFANKATADAFDMSGNVKEWTQARAAGENPLRGGASNNEVNGTTCGLDFTLANDTFFFPNVGFRCCR